MSMPDRLSEDERGRALTDSRPRAAAPGAGAAPGGPGASAGWWRSRRIGAAWFQIHRTMPGLVRPAVVPAGVRGRHPHRGGALRPRPGAGGRGHQHRERLRARLALEPGRGGADAGPARDGALHGPRQPTVRAPRPSGSRCPRSTSPTGRRYLRYLIDRYGTSARPGGLQRRGDEPDGLARAGAPPGRGPPDPRRHPVQRDARLRQAGARHGADLPARLRRPPLHALPRGPGRDDGALAPRGPRRRGRTGGTSATVGTEAEATSVSERRRRHNRWGRHRWR